jgi:hypothetical protein
LPAMPSTIPTIDSLGRTDASGTTILIDWPRAHPGVR